MAQLFSPQARSWAPRFFTVWTAQALSLLGSQLVQFALIWWLTKTTGSAVVLTTASLVGLLPQIFIMPLAGALVDRWNRRVVMMVSDGIIALATLVLAGLFLTGYIQIWHIYALMFVRSVLGGFHWTAMQASTSLMVPKEHLSRIQGLNQMLNGALSIGAAPLGALLMSILLLHSIVMIDVTTAALAIIPLFFFAIPQPEVQAAAADQGKPSVWQDFRAGLQYVWSWPGLVMILIMATIINLVVNPGFVLMPILITRHFKGEALQLAWMESAWGVGMFGGGLLLSVWGGFRRRIVTSMLGLIVMGLATVVIGLTPASMLLLAIACMFIGGVANPIVNGPLMAVIQAAVAPEMQGRVFTLINSAASAMMPIGLIVAGPIADQLGVQTWFIVGGLVTVIMGIVAFFIPAIMHIEDGRVAPADQPQAEPSKLVLTPTDGD
jgi:DHA3 family macrolide efflux protein-like MFS transporter